MGLIEWYNHLHARCCWPQRQVSPGVSVRVGQILWQNPQLSVATHPEWVLVHGIAQCGWRGGCVTSSLRDPGSPSRVKTPGRLDRLWRDSFAQLRFHKVKVRRSEVWPWVWVARSPLWPRLLLRGSCPFSNSQTSMLTMARWLTECLFVWMTNCPGFPGLEGLCGMQDKTGTALCKLGRVCCFACSNTPWN